VDETPGLTACRLAHLGLIRVAGADRAQFLQGQLTQDVRAVGPARSAPYGWTTPQGRVLANGQLFDWDGALWLTVAAASAETLAGRLRTFVLRAKVSVEVAALPIWGLRGAAARQPLAIAGAALPAEPLACAGTAAHCALRPGGDPARILIVARDAGWNVAALGARSGSEAEWLLADVRAGLALIGPATADAFLPQMINLDLIGAISFDKGCYTGQEIIARTRYQGRLKRRMLRFRCASPPLLMPGAPVYSSGRESGQVVAAAHAPGGQELLAVTILERRSALSADSAGLVALESLGLPYEIPELGAPQ
jgi:hypothetical protein